MHLRGSGEIGELGSALNGALDRLSARELNAFGKELIESLPGVFYMIDRQGNYLMWNSNLERVLQRSAKEMASSHPLDFFEGEDKAAIDTAMRHVFEQGEVSVEAVLVAKDGTKTPYYFTGRRVQRDGEPVLVGMGLDIAVQREGVRVTNALLQRNQTLMQNSMEGIHVMDVEGDVLEVNDAFCRMLGYTREEVMHLNVRDWDKKFTPEELRVRFRDFIGKSGMFETVHRRKDGGLLDVEICTTGVEIDGKGYLFASSRDITERKKGQAAMRRHERVIETAMDGFWMTDERGYVEEVNAAYAAMSGYTIQQLVGMHISHLEVTGQPEESGAHLGRISSGGTSRFETQHRRKDGKVIDIEMSITYMPECRKFFVFCHDITQRKLNEGAMRVAAATFETQDATLITDAQANIIRVNRAFTRITGYTPEEVMGKNPNIMSSGRQDKAFYGAMWRQILETGGWAGEIWDRRKDGVVYPKWLTITAVKNELGVTTQYVAIFSDITERKQAEEEIRNLAFYDALTQLPNRRLFQERVHAALAASARYADFGAILFIDLDRFKLLNDTLGHEYGDLLLVEVAARIRHCVREMDTVARLGGDEFVVLLEGISGDKADASYRIERVAEKIRQALSSPYRLREHEHHSSPSIGITLYHGNDESMEALLKHADAAMYQAKNAGRNTICFYDPALQHDLESRAALEHDMRHAMANGGLRLLYQVQVDKEHRAVGFEALIRWLHPQRGEVLPASFIPVAEESSLILDIGDWVLETACTRLAAWGRDARMREMTLAINVSAHQFRHGDFVDQVDAALRRHGVRPSRLRLELTESIALHDLDEVVQRMQALKELGVQLSLDDFGTGYSSLSMLKRLPLDQLKIDQGFVRDIASDPASAVTAQTIIDMAKNFGLDVIAEGVESEAQLAFLKHHDCKAYQGWLFGAPAPAEELPALMEKLGGV